MRLLTEQEISSLKLQKCSSIDWTLIKVDDNFTPKHICNVHFSGNVTLGVFEKEYKSASGIKKQSGIYNAALHNCTVGNNVFINNIANHIANYCIQDNCYIENVGLLEVTGKSTFGNGVTVNVLNEAGGREVRIFDRLSVHLAYILALYRHRPSVIEKINALIDSYVNAHASEMGVIGAGTRIINSKCLRNVRIEKNACIENVSELYDGSINSTEENPVFVGTDVIARHFIIGQGSKVYDGALIEKCFIGESCEVGKQYSAIDSLIFCNSQLLHGEATAIFAGPYTTSHHKSTLLIGCMFSFYNAGSGTNQSNHMYKLGPNHQGIFERGVKTGSDSYVMLEAKIGAFSLVLGHHEAHFDTSELPFSYILESDGRSMLIPAVNFQTVGTQRDSQKWPKRDKREGKDLLDCIVFDLLNPFTVQKISRGIEVLSVLKEKSADSHNYKNIRIKNIFVNKGISIYQSAINYYLGQKLVEKIESCKNIDFGVNKALALDKWIDLAGLVAPQPVIEELLNDMEDGRIRNTADIEAFFVSVHEKYKQYEWSYVFAMLHDKMGEVNKDTMASFLSIYMNEINVLTDAIISDAAKEFGSASKVSFGADGDADTLKKDFINVRGDLATDPFITDLEKRRKTELQRVEKILKTL